jgi:hypothetical protein
MTAAQIIAAPQPPALAFGTSFTTALLSRVAPRRIAEPPEQAVATGDEPPTGHVPMNPASAARLAELSASRSA